MFRRFLSALLLSLFMARSLAAQTDFSWQNCAPSAPIAVTSMSIGPDRPRTPAPLALTASVDATTEKITDVHAYLMFGPLAFFLDSGPLSLDVGPRFVFLPAAIPMTTATATIGTIAGVASTCTFLEPYHLPCKEPIKANSYSSPVNSGIPFIFGDAASLDTVEATGFSKVDITPTNLVGGSVALSFNGIPGFPLPPPSLFTLLPPRERPEGSYAAQVELLDPNSKTLGCLSMQLGTSFVACSDFVAAKPHVLTPTGQMTPVAVDITTSRGCSAGACAITAVSTNDGSDAVASGEAAITGALNLNLKGAESGLVYTVTLQCADAFGAITNKSVSVSVR